MKKEVLRTLKGTVSGVYALAEVKQFLKKKGIGYEVRESEKYNRLFVETDDKDDDFKDVEIE